MVFPQRSVQIAFVSLLLTVAEGAKPVHGRDWLVPVTRGRMGGPPRLHRQVNLRTFFLLA